MVYGCRIAVVLSRRHSLCWMLKVDAGESRRVDCLLVCGDSASRRWGWSRCLVQIVSVAVWSGCRRIWRRSKMWMHWLQRLDDPCNPWLTRFVSMWLRSAGPNRLVARGQDSYCMILSATTDDAGADCRGCMIKVPVCSILG